MTSCGPDGLVSGGSSRGLWFIPHANPIWCFAKLGVPFWGGPNDKDYSVLESILGSPMFWETTTS